jgi:hypothetical protein
MTKPFKSPKADSSPWLGFVWLLMGPVPLFLVLAWQAHRPEVARQTPISDKPAVLMVAAPSMVAPAKPETAIRPQKAAANPPRSPVQVPVK